MSDTPDQKNVQSHLSKIAHINLLLAVCVLIGVAAVYAWFRWGMHSAQVTNTNNANTTNSGSTTTQNTNTVIKQEPTAEDTAKLTQAYEDSVNSILKDADMSDATQAKTLSDQISALHVPADLRPVQIQLIVALQAAQNGKVDDANQRIAQLRAQYSWFAQ